MTNNASLRIVQFQDESRTIASEYVGGLSRYAKIERQTTASTRESELISAHRQQQTDGGSPLPGIVSAHRSAGSGHPSQSFFYSDNNHIHSNSSVNAQISSRKDSEPNFITTTGPSHTVGYSVLMQDALESAKDEGSRAPSLHAYKGSDASSGASPDRPAGIGQ